MHKGENMNIKEILEKNQIQYWTSGKNVTPGWVHIKCPMCDDHSNHGGFSETGTAYSCWRCGKHKVKDVLKILTGYFYKVETETYEKPDKNHEEYTECIGTRLQTAHLAYLAMRGFDSPELESLYGVKGTLHTPKDFAYRIIIPIYDRAGGFVGFQGRAISENQIPKYKNTPGLQIKDYLYSENLVLNREKVIVVEGVFDCWKMGVGCVATFGTMYTQKQLLLLSEYKTVHILFDNDEAGVSAAEKLKFELECLGVEVVIEKLPDKIHDPGELEKEQVQEIKERVFV
jgi:5S rRNA maturation endonuclease (ribonuclease M5)